MRASSCSVAPGHVGAVRRHHVHDRERRRVQSRCRWQRLHLPHHEQPGCRPRPRRQPDPGRARPVPGGLLAQRRVHRCGRSRQQGAVRLPITFRAQFHDTTSEEASSTCDSGLAVKDDDGNVVVFQTKLAQVKVQDCASTGIPNALVQYLAGDRHNVGYTDAQGRGRHRALRGGYDFRAILADTTSSTVNAANIDSQPAALTITAEFRHPELQWHRPVPGGLLAYNFTKPTMNLFGSTVNFRFDGYEQAYDISGCGFGVGRSILVANLKNSSGSPVSGGTVHLGVGGWPVIVLPMRRAPWSTCTPACWATCRSAWTTATRHRDEPIAERAQQRSLRLQDQARRDPAQDARWDLDQRRRGDHRVRRLAGHRHHR